MVFEWFFETKSGKKKGKKSFKKFLKEIKELEHIDKLIEIPLKDQTIDEKEESIICFAGDNPLYGRNKNG